MEKSARIVYASTNLADIRMPTSPPRDPAEASVKPILEWLALNHGQTGQDVAFGLQQQLVDLRGAPVPAAHRLRLLDLLHAHAATLVQAQWPVLRKASLPISRRIRQAAYINQQLLEALAQDYLNTLAELFDPEGKPHSPLNALYRAMQCLSWHLLTSQLVAAPAGVGIWQQLHTTFRTARQFGLSIAPLPGETRSIQRIYISNLLIAAAQPASFTAAELEFISQYIEACGCDIPLGEETPREHDGIFWLDPERDTPPHALARRLPPPDTPVLYLACDCIAQAAGDHLAALENGQTAASLGLPDFADRRGGRGVLRRLAALWGRPIKRKFPRRRQSYRAELCTGLDQLWHLLGSGEDKPLASQWMITNESADGFAMMHVSGDTDLLRVGDIVAVRPRREDDPEDADWYICMVRWALSENPEHIEAGLQIVAPRAVPAILALPRGPGRPTRLSALLLPKTPPLRPAPALVVPSGSVNDQAQKMVLLVEQDNVSVHEVYATRLNEQTSCVEVFTVEPDESQ